MFISAEKEMAEQRKHREMDKDDQRAPVSTRRTWWRLIIFFGISLYYVYFRAAVSVRVFDSYNKNGKDCRGFRIVKDDEK